MGNERNDIMKLYFINSRNEERLIGSGTEKECWNMIEQFLIQHDFKAYYYQTTETDTGLWIDVGSWSEFFEMRKES